jgi:hypothetical protein
MVYWLIWLVIIFLPLIFWDISDFAQRKRIVGGWIRILPFLLIFLVHNFILLPYLLLKNKHVKYFTITVLLILFVNYLFIYNHFFHDLLYHVFSGFNLDRGNFRDGVEKLEKFPGSSGRPGEGHGGMHGRGGHYKRWHSPDYLVYTYNVVVSILVVAFNATLKYTSRWLKEEQKRKEIEKENMHSQLKSLQQQVSPHFFMNTLNNIHALIQYDKKDAQEAILRLSKMMRYLLYDSEKEKTTLRKEIDFLSSYIDLMKLRMNESIELIVNFPEKFSDIEIYPYLFISLLENAFKYGIDHKRKAFIHVVLEIINGKIHFNVKNSKPETMPDNGDSSGIGIENTKKRLDLLFDDNYELRIFNRDSEFEVDLILPYED